MKNGNKLVLIGLIMIIFSGMILYFFMEQHANPTINALNEPQPLAQQLDQLLQEDISLKGSIAGISIRAADTGELIYDHFGDTRLRPASNMKLLTGAAALSVLGEDYSFSTDILADGNIKNNLLKGDLFLKGKGDPTLLPSDFDQLAKELKQLGITYIEGDIVGDDSWYDDVRLSPDLIWSDESYYYGAQISALTVSPNKDYDAGTIIVEVSPETEVGDEPMITISPPTNYVKIVNDAKMVTADSEKDLNITRKHGTNIIKVEGQLPINANGIREWIAVSEPTQYALELFSQSLIKHGIHWTGHLKVGTAPSQAEKLITHPSIPLADLFVPFMKISNNGHGEILIKEMGKVVKEQGSWEQGIEVLMDELPAFGVNPDTVVIRDGSGISHINLIPANEVSKLLYNVQDEDWFSTYLRSFPIAGESDRMVGGTLTDRFNDITNSVSVKAKTGSISTVSSLSGYMITKNDESLIFSVLLNNLADDVIGKEIEDRIVAILAEY